MSTATESAPSLEAEFTSLQMEDQQRAATHKNLTQQLAEIKDAPPTHMLAFRTAPVRRRRADRA